MNNINLRTSAGSLLTDVSVLLVEDIPMMQELIAHVLNCFGAQKIIKANDAQKAYELLVSQRPNIMVCDWQMAPVSGIELVKKVRSDKNHAHYKMPIIMITGFASSTAVKEARDIGVDEFLVKPFTAERLASRLISVIENPRPFIEADTYRGPDRRRSKNAAFYIGPMRRDSDYDHDSLWSVSI